MLITTLGSRYCLIRLCHDALLRCRRLHHIRTLYQVILSLYECSGRRQVQVVDFLYYVPLSGHQRRYQDLYVASVVLRMIISSLHPPYLSEASTELYDALYKLTTIFTVFYRLIGRPRCSCKILYHFFRMFSRLYSLCYISLLSSFFIALIAPHGCCYLFLLLGIKLDVLYLEKQVIFTPEVWT